MTGRQICCAADIRYTETGLVGCVRYLWLYDAVTAEGC